MNGWKAVWLTCPVNSPAFCSQIYPQQSCENFKVALNSGLPDLNITIQSVDSDREQTQQQSYRLDLIGQDRPGIIHRISSLLVKNGATVEDLESEVIEASMSGEKLFKATITLCLADGYSIDELGEALEQLANELIVDIELG